MKAKQKKQSEKGKKVLKILGFLSLCFIFTIIVISAILSLRVHASGWVEETTNKVAEYTKHPLHHYSLDFYVNTDWDWLPWNWGEGIGNTAYYTVYLLTNVFWILNAYLSYLVGFIVEQAYELDFISKTISHMARNMQQIAGVNKSGFTSGGLLANFAPILVIIFGGYFTYTGLVKRQVTKAINSLVTFVVIFVFGMGFIAYSEDYLNTINNFQKGFNQEVLNIGSKLTMSQSTLDSDDPVTSIRNTLFEIQVKKPYLLLQYGNADESVIGESRVSGLLDLDPLANDDKRANYIKEEVDKKENTNMGFQMVAMRLGMVLVIIIVNLVISACVAIYSGMMIFSQVMFILFMSFIPIAITFALFPNMQRILTKAIVKCFNALMTKAGITLLMTVVFSLSSMFYTLSADNNFFWMMFLQIVIFVGSLMKSNELLGFMHLNASDSEQMNNKARKGMNLAQYTLNRLMYRNLINGGLNRLGGNSKGNPSSNMVEKIAGTSSKVPKNQSRKKERPQSDNPYVPKNKMEQLGATVANVADTKNKARDKFNKAKETIKDAPLNARYATSKAKDNISRTMKSAKDDLYQGAVLSEISNNAKRREMAQKRVSERKAKMEALNGGASIQRRMAGEKEDSLQSHIADKKAALAMNQQENGKHQRKKAEVEKKSQAIQRNVVDKQKEPVIRQENGKTQRRNAEMQPNKGTVQRNTADKKKNLAMNQENGKLQRGKLEGQRRNDSIQHPLERRKANPSTTNRSRGYEDGLEQIKKDLMIIEQEKKRTTVANKNTSTNVRQGRKPINKKVKK